ncbi:I78 family peptidase inhibitor [Paracoccus sp. S-4012]|uniref:I78 family peptidase inhibitor n=1 Tax=Paracoccus sp. S-4012 TaxID=2665648 RepID=UPI001E2D0BE0|nr:I78 family peptidase inhibitor [Paracoccus sp. S-4012]
MRKLASAAVLLLLAACGGGGDGISIDSASGSCGAARFERLLGRPDSALRGVSLPQGARVNRAGQEIRADYVAGRLNIDVGSDGVIEALRCG